MFYWFGFNSIFAIVSNDPRYVGATCLWTGDQNRVCDQNLYQKILDMWEKTLIKSIKDEVDCTLLLCGAFVDPIFMVAYSKILFKTIHIYNNHTIKRVIMVNICENNY